MKTIIILLLSILILSCSSYRSMGYVCDCDQLMKVDSMVAVHKETFTEGIKTQNKHDIAMSVLREVAIQKLCSFKLIWHKPNGDIDWSRTDSIYKDIVIVHY